MRRLPSPSRIMQILWIIVLSEACSGGRPPPAPLTPETQTTQSELGPIMGPITKEKVLDRLKGYPICGMISEEQKMTLKVMIFPIKREDEALSVSLIQVECFFFGVQGLYEFALINPQDGRVYPLGFEGAEPVKEELSGSERRSPVAINQGRAEVCGVPTFDPKTKRVQALCKADSEGGCGVLAQYTLTQPSPSLDTSYFKLDHARFHSCAQPALIDRERWEEL